MLKYTLPGLVLPAGVAEKGVAHSAPCRPVAASGLASQRCLVLLNVLLPPGLLFLCWFPVLTVCHFLNLSAPASLGSSYCFCLLSFIFLFLARPNLSEALLSFIPGI